MTLTSVSIAKNLYDCGQNRLKYENQSQSIRNELILLRAVQIINYDAEFQLIQDLETIEYELHHKTQATVLDMGSKTIKVCAGPAAGFATKIVTQVAKKQTEGSDQDLLTDISDSFAKEVSNEATKTACKKTAEWAVDWLGAAGVIGIMATPAAGIALGTVAAASLLIPSVREYAYDFVANACKGTEAILDETASKLFAGMSKNQEIINAYRIYEKKKETLAACSEEYTNKSMQLKIARDVHHEKIRILKDLKQEIKKEKQILGGEKETLSKLNFQIDFEEILLSEKKNLKELKNKIKKIENVYEQNSASLSDLNQKILIRKKKKIYRIVKYFNKPNFFHKLLTRIFAAVFKKFKTEKELQEKEAGQKKTLKKNLAQLKSNLNDKNLKVQEKENYINAHPSEGKLEDMQTEKLNKEEFIAEQQVRVKEKKLKAIRKEQFLLDQVTKMDQLSQEVDLIATKVLNKTTKLNVYESDYVYILRN